MQYQDIEEVSNKYNNVCIERHAETLFNSLNPVPNIGTS